MIKLLLGWVILNWLLIFNKLDSENIICKIIFENLFIYKINILSIAKMEYKYSDNGLAN